MRVGNKSSFTFSIDSSVCSTLTRKSVFSCSQSPTGSAYTYQNALHTSFWCPKHKQQKHNKNLEWEDKNTHSLVIAVAVCNKSKDTNEVQFTERHLSPWIHLGWFVVLLLNQWSDDAAGTTEVLATNSLSVAHTEESFASMDYISQPTR